MPRTASGIGESRLEVAGYSAVRVCGMFPEAFGQAFVRTRDRPDSLRLRSG